MIKYILLDNYGVLTDGKERKRFITKIFNKYRINKQLHNDLWIENLGKLDIGKLKVDEYIKMFNKKFKINVTISEYFDMFASQIKKNDKLLNKLKNTKSKIFIVSDNFPSLSNRLEKKLGNQFKKYKKFYSFDYKTTKQKKMFKNVLNILKAKPEDCLFIDNSKKNIEKAKSYKINSILFRDNKNVFKEFKKYKIIVP